MATDQATKVYGPHREETTPRHVTVLGSKRYPKEREELIPEVLLRQRRLINERASRTMVTR